MPSPSWRSIKSLHTYEWMGEKFDSHHHRPFLQALSVISDDATCTCMNIFACMSLVFSSLLYAVMFKGKEENAKRAHKAKRGERESERRKKEKKVTW